MGGLGLTVTPAFLLLAAALYFAGGGAAITAFFTAALAHELGHLAALTVAGASVRRVRITATGPVIEYAGAVDGRQEAGIVAAGPLAGLLFAGGCFLVGTPYFRFVGAVALLSSAFNLLPVMPMDGGRLALFALETVFSEHTASVILRVLGTLCALGVTVTGVTIRSPAAAAAGIWMAVLANCPELR